MRVVGVQGRVMVRALLAVWLALLLWVAPLYSAAAADLSLAGRPVLPIPGRDLTAQPNGWPRPSSEVSGAPWAQIFQLSVSPAAALAPFGVPVTYTIFLTNTSSLTETYRLAVEDSRERSFISQLSSSLRTLGPGQSARDLNLVVVPLTSTVGLVNVSTLVATAARKPNPSLTATVVTTIGSAPDAPGGLAGSVLSLSGEPVSRAAVHWYYSDWSYGGVQRTGSDGSYTISGLTPGKYYLEVDASSFGYARTYYDGAFDRHVATALTVAPGKVAAGLDLRLHPGGALSGRVYQENGGRPIAGAWVEVQPADGRSHYSFSALAGSDGSYAIRGVAPGRYYLRAGAGGYAPRYYPGSSTPTDATVVNVVASVNVPGLDLRLPSQEPLEVANVQISSVSESSFVVSWVTNHAVTGAVRFGLTDTQGIAVTLGVAEDRRGSSFAGRTHFVPVGGSGFGAELRPSAEYWFEVLAGPEAEPWYRGSTRTGSNLARPHADLHSGQIRDSAGQPIGGALLYLTVQRPDGSGTPLAALSDVNGYWQADLAQTRSLSLTAPFPYSTTDSLVVRVEAGPDGAAYRVVALEHTSPISATVYPKVSHRLELGIGWNVVSLPIEPLEPLSLSRLAEDVRAGGGRLVEAYRYRGGRWEGALISPTTGVVEAGDFSLLVGEGYFLRFAGRTSWTVTGKDLTPGTTVTLQSSWNLVGLPRQSNAVRAADLAAADARVQEVARWVYGGYEGHAAGYPFNNFPLEPGRAYFLRVETPLTWVLGQ